VIKYHVVRMTFFGRLGESGGYRKIANYFMHKQGIEVTFTNKVGAGFFKSQLYYN